MGVKAKSRVGIDETKERLGSQLVQLVPVGCSDLGTAVRTNESVDSGDEDGLPIRLCLRGRSEPKRE